MQQFRYPDPVCPGAGGISRPDTCPEHILIPVRIAGISAVIATLHRSTAEFFRGYRSDPPEPGALRISVSPEEIAARRSSLCPANDPPLSYPAVERILIHTRLTEYLLQYDIILIHGSAVSMDGRCYLFTAPSGTGKSTHARLWREAFGERCFAVNDDKPYLICRENAVTVCGAPWSGKHGYGRNTSVPLKAIGILHRSEVNRAVRLTAAEAFGVLYQQTYRPDTIEGQKTVLKLLARVADNAALYDIYCNMDPDAALMSYTAMRWP